MSYRYEARHACTATSHHETALRSAFSSNRPYKENEARREIGVPIEVKVIPIRLNGRQWLELRRALVTTPLAE
jgi:hypothetical protein